jgi:asparagine synthase (glutamine-hydrolysing)
MPGIVGIISRAPVEERSIDQMIGCMVHEPFYRFGKYINKKIGLYSGWVCHKGSFSDCMPVWNETKNVCLIFTGEDFRDPNEIDRLKVRGHQCDIENASYLVHLYEEMGIEFIEKINGWFSGVLVDLGKQNIVLFNDRYGLGRIYHHQNADGFYFSSEAKSLLKALPKLRQLDNRGLAETFSCGCVLQNRTLFSGISLLPGGGKWVFSQSDDIRKDRYFIPEIWEKQPLLTKNEFSDELERTFARILPRYFSGRRKIGMSLTGGLDGRIILAWSKRPPGEMPCYSFGGPYRDCIDVRIARKLARLFRQSHETIKVNSLFTNEFPLLAEKSVYVSDGTMDVTGSVELYVNRVASRIAPVRLTGNYGSEILRGNVAFRPVFLNEDLWEAEFVKLVRNAAKTYDGERLSHNLSFIAFKQVPWHHYSRFSMEQSQLTVRSPYLDNDLVSLMYQAPPELILSKEPSLRLIAKGNADLCNIPTDRGVFYRPTPIIGSIRHLFEEFAVRSEYVYDYGMPHWLVRIDHILAPLYLERLFLGRHKFYHFRIWYRDELSKYLKDVLLDSRTRSRPYLDRRHLEKIVRSHTAGERNYTLEIHRILTTELIQSQLIEQS